MDKGLSVYLDALRFTASMIVLLRHATMITGYGDVFGDIAHEAVIVFFVLSGYVIAFVSHTKERTFDEYGIARLSRIYSVALPAILLTVVLDAWRLSWAPHVSAYQFQHLWAYVPLYTVFGTDWWFLNEDMLSNSPFWSLSYEFWYYVVFAAMFYLAGRRRWLTAGAILLLIGPRQWILFPLWLAGCALYYGHKHGRYSLSPAWARGLFLGSMAVYAAVKSLGGFHVLDATVDLMLGGWPSAYLRYSQYFAGDYLIAVLVLLNIHAARYCNFSTLIRFERPIRWAASFTFSVYLFHMPLLKFYGDALGTDPNDFSDFVVLMFATLATIMVLGSITERQKWRLKNGLRALRRMVPRLTRAIG